MPRSPESTSIAISRGREPLGSRDLLAEVQRRGGVAVSACLQCHKCASGCPVGDDADFRSSQVLRLLQLGGGVEVLACRAIWLCASCQACTARCPMGIDVARVMDTLRILAVELRVPLAITRDKKFAGAFLASVRRHGRVFELGMLTAYKIATLTLLRDLDKGLRMAFARKLRLWPSHRRSARNMPEVFRRARTEENAR
jgi:heterodisulfide reductase subunit C2